MLEQLNAIERQTRNLKRMILAVVIIWSMSIGLLVAHLVHDSFAFGKIRQDVIELQVKQENVLCQLPLSP